MQFTRLAIAAALTVMPTMTYAAVFDLNATIGGDPHALGSVTIADSIVASGHLGLSRVCPTANVCTSGGPWDQVSFDVSPPALAAAIAGQGDGTLDSLELDFDPSGQVISGRFSIDSDTFGHAAVFLQAFGSGGTIQTGEVTFGIGAQPLTLMWTPAGQVAGAQRSIPEPSSMGLLMAGLTVLFGGSVWRRR